MSSLASSPGRIAAIARVTLVEAVRQKLFVFVMLISVALMFGSLLLREFNFGASELKFLADFGFGVLTFFGTILAVVSAAQLFFSEIENRTALTILAKPVHRFEFIAGKFSGVVLVLLVFTAVTAGAMIVVLWARQIVLLHSLTEIDAKALAVDLPAVAVVAVLQWGKFCVIAAITVLVASYSNTNLFTVGLSFMIVLIGHLQHIAARAWEHAANPLGRVVARVISLLFPNFQLYNLAPEIGGGHARVFEAVSVMAGYSVIYVIAVLALAVFSFRHREI